MSQGRRFLAPLILLFLFTLSACGERYAAYNPGLVAPADLPPPLPERKPSPPEGFLAVNRDSQEELAGDDDISVISLSPAPVASPTPATSQTIVSQPVVSQQATGQQATGQPQISALPSKGRHIVVAGETLYGIARRYQVPPRALIDANELRAPYDLLRGQELRIPQPRVHRVVSGDNLYSVARRYAVQVNELVRLNNLQAPFSIQVGQTLNLPGRQIAAVAAPKNSGEEKVTVASSSKSNEVVQLPQPPARAGGRFLWPVEGKIISDYGRSADGQQNDGINILAPRGAPVRATDNGVVAYRGDALAGFGNLILVKHADGWVSAYAHNQAILVSVGSKVQKGQTIARVGTSGSVARPQLHFELRRGTRAVDPMKYLDPL